MTGRSKSGRPRRVRYEGLFSVHDELRGPSRSSRPLGRVSGGARPGKRRGNRLRGLVWRAKQTRAVEGKLIFCMPRIALETGSMVAPSWSINCETESNG
ncbi:unnamed protein product, partial [Iphiclides podalirius]